MNKRNYVIGDPVHDYVVVAPHEQIIVDHPVTQRLRRITQTGLAEQVFPEARTSRFIHSLGAMHLASMFLVACIENADDGTRRKFFDEIKALPQVKDYQVDKSEFTKSFGSEGTICAIQSSRWLNHSSSNARNEQLLLAMCECALRFAALFHDLGHMPFSHDFEYALKDFASTSTASRSEKLQNAIDKKAPHEEVGHALAHIVFLSSSTEVEPWVKAAFNLAREILNTETEYETRSKSATGAVAWLHSLIDGEIDADRADYLLRDGRALGLDFAHYDLARLVANLTLVHDSELGFATAVKEHGLVAVESYYLARARSNQVMVRHHKVAQSAAALRYACVQALGTLKGQSFLQALDEVITFDAEDKVNAKELLLKFTTFDDTWCFQLLRELQSSSKDVMTQASLSLVLDRQKTLRSLWKRIGDLSDAEKTGLNDRLDNLFAMDGAISVVDLRRKLLSHNILLLTHKFKPFALRPNGDSVLQITTSRGLQPVSRLSAYLPALSDAWKADIHVHAFDLSANPRSKDASRELVIKESLG